MQGYVCRAMCAGLCVQGYVCRAMCAGLCVQGYACRAMLVSRVAMYKITALI